MSILFIHLQGYCILIFFTLDSSAQLIVSRRCWDFAPASDEIFKQKLFRFSLQWHYCSQWEVSKQLCWPFFWSDATESRKGTVSFLLVKMQCILNVGVKLMGLSSHCYNFCTSHLKYNWRRSKTNEQRVSMFNGCNLYSGALRKPSLMCCTWKTGCLFNVLENGQMA